MKHGQFFASRFLAFFVAITQPFLWCASLFVIFLESQPQNIIDKFLSLLKLRNVSNSTSRSTILLYKLNRTTITLGRRGARHHHSSCIPVIGAKSSGNLVKTNIYFSKIKNLNFKLFFIMDIRPI